jgi:acetyl-CoA acyltransferase
MSKQIQDAYIVAATRTPIGKSHKGYFRNTRPDDLLAAVLRSALRQAPGLDPAAIEDLVCGCAIPEAQQGLNVARMGAVLAGLPKRWAASPSTAFAPRVCRRCRSRPTASAWARPR